MTHPILQAVLDDILTLHPKVIDLSLERLTRLLHALDHPEHHLPPVLHIAGTNGKGSVHAFLKAILHAQGYRVHAYSSPHLVRFNERIVLNGKPVDDAVLIDVLEEILRVNGRSPITFFELTTAAAFVLFSRIPADVLVLETGLGGRLDATNVVENPLATIITPISHDHKEFLGETLAKIAFEKAGIMKKNVPVILGQQPVEAMDVLLQVAQQHVAPTHHAAITHSNNGFTHNGISYPAPSLQGYHQYENAGIALTCLDVIQGRLPTSHTVRCHGLTHTHWPARLQDITHSRLHAYLPANSQLILDGGHNAGAGVILADYLKHKPRPIDLILGMQAHKDAAAFLQPLLPLCRLVTCVPIPDKGMLTHTPPSLGLPSASQSESIVPALESLPRDAATILIAGSLYLAGAILRDYVD